MGLRASSAQALNRQAQSRCKTMKCLLTLDSKDAGSARPPPGATHNSIHVPAKKAPGHLRLAICVSEVMTALMLAASAEPLQGLRVGVWG